jgi:hypothetical protein
MSCATVTSVGALKIPVGLVCTASIPKPCSPAEAAAAGPGGPGGPEGTGGAALLCTALEAIVCLPPSQARESLAEEKRCWVAELGLVRPPSAAATRQLKQRAGEGGHGTHERVEVEVVLSRPHAAVRTLTEEEVQLRRTAAGVEEDADVQSRFGYEQIWDGGV